MAKKEKGRGRQIYFRDASLWDRLLKVAQAKGWSLNQVVERTIAPLYPEKK